MTIIMLCFLVSWLFIYPEALFTTLKFGFWNDGLSDKFMAIFIYFYVLGAPIFDYFTYFR